MRIYHNAWNTWNIYAFWIFRQVTYRTDANNNRTFCIKRIRLVTAENWARKWLLAQFTIEIVFISNRIQGKKGLENNDNRGYYWRRYGTSKDHIFYVGKAFK